MSLLIAEDGTGVVGANALATPSAVALQLHTLGLISGTSATVADVTIASGTLSGTGLGDVLVAGRVVRVEASSSTAYVYVDAVDGDEATISWDDDLLTETSDVDLVVFAATGWAGTRDALEASIIQATVYLSNLAWYGGRVDAAQALPWPRLIFAEPGYPYSYEIGTDEVPIGVLRATAELALAHVTFPLSSSIDPSRALKRKKVGPIEKEWSTSLGAATPRTHPQALRHVRGLHRGGQATGRLVPS